MPAWVLSRPSGVPDPIQIGGFGAPGLPTFGTNVPVNFTSTSSVILSATSSAAFTFGAPSPLVKGQLVTFVIRNTSGGALSGTNPFTNAIYRLATWTQPTNGNNRSITFLYDGSHLVEINRTASDIPN